MIGQRLLHYKIVDKLGEGGMGVVYKARDTHLDRFVAIKVLAADKVADPERKRRFIQEAKAASALNHPNIVTVHDVASDGATDFIAMEYVAGQTLAKVVGRQGLPLQEALNYAVQIADGLAAAHTAGIVHRDIKPGNIMVTEKGLVKILDFGLAKLSGPVESDPSGTTLTMRPQTEAGALVGTVAYMSPEQAEGKPVDARSDVFSLGAVLYEIAAGQRPFRGDSNLSILAAILHEQPIPLTKLRPDIPAELQNILARCLEKDCERRYASASELWKEIAACQSRRRAPGLGSLLRKPRVAVPALALVLAVLAAATWFVVTWRRANWARSVALPEITRLLEKEDFDAAFRLGWQAERYIRGDTELRRLQYHYQSLLSASTEPPGADLYVKGYLNVGGGWIYLGKSPIENTPVPSGSCRWRAAKPGFEEATGTFNTHYTGLRRQFTLHPLGAAPPGMVAVPGGDFALSGLPPVRLEDFWLDKYEVTNRQFREFVDRGGYSERDFWKHPMVKDGKVLSWEQAMAEFRDTTGRPGPSTWELGTYAEGRDDFPVGGISWYEAAAYAEFVGKSLPTLYHWYRAAAPGVSDILQLSNFSGKGPARVGSYQGLSPYGSYEMAGNVREWCWNQSRGGPAGTPRHISGGSWSEASYIFSALWNAALPLDRSAINGFRCAQYATPLSDVLLAPIENLLRDYSKENPVGDDIFRTYRGFYSYDRTDLKAAVESVDNSARHWRVEKVSLSAAYGNERVIARLFLPNNADAPYQTVIYFPGATTLTARSSDELIDVVMFEFLLRSGRAVLYPVYKGTYERRMDPSRQGPSLRRERAVYWSKDFGRSIDYLETRPDIDHQRLAFYGFSLGGIYGPLLTAIDGRVKASILLGGGFFQDRVPPEIDPLHFAPRAKNPVLMVVGRHDFVRPVEACQRPLFRLLGAPAEDKRMVLVDTGHPAYPSQEVVKEILQWLDRYLGPVQTKRL